MISDPFKVLGVRDDCSDADLKKAYREKSKSGTRIRIREKRNMPRSVSRKSRRPTGRSRMHGSAGRALMGVPAVRATAAEMVSRDHSSRDHSSRISTSRDRTSRISISRDRTSRINISRAAIRTDAVMRIMEHTMTSLINGSHTLSREGSRRRRRRPLKSRQPADISITGLTGRL